MNPDESVKPELESDPPVEVIPDDEPGSDIKPEKPDSPVPQSKKKIWLISGIIAALLILLYLIMIPVLGWLYDHTDFADKQIEWAAKALPLDMVGEGLLESQSELIAILGEKGEAALPYLQEAITSDNPGMVHAGAMGVYTLGAKGAPAIPGLIKALSNHNSYARIAAALALGSIGPQAAPAIPQLGKTLRDKHSYVRMCSATALQQIGDDTAIALIAEAMEQEINPLVIQFMQKSKLRLMGKPTHYIPPFQELKEFY